MKKLALILLLSTSACSGISPYAFNKRSTEIDYELLQKEYACADTYACSAHPVPYYLK